MKDFINVQDCSRSYNHYDRALDDKCMKAKQQQQMRNKTLYWCKRYTRISGKFQGFDCNEKAVTFKQQYTKKYCDIYKQQ